MRLTDNDDECICYLTPEKGHYCVLVEAGDFSWGAESVPDEGLDGIASMIGHALHESCIAVSAVRYVLPEGTPRVELDALTKRMQEAVMRGFEGQFSRPAVTIQ